MTPIPPGHDAIHEVTPSANPMPVYKASDPLEHLTNTIEEAKTAILTKLKDLEEQLAELDTRLADLDLPYR